MLKNLRSFSQNFYIFHKLKKKQVSPWIFSAKHLSNEKKGAKIVVYCNQEQNERQKGICYG